MIRNRVDNATGWLFFQPRRPTRATNFCCCEPALSYDAQPNLVVPVGRPTGGGHGCSSTQH